MCTVLFYMKAIHFELYDTLYFDCPILKSFNYCNTHYHISSVVTVHGRMTLVGKFKFYAKLCLRKTLLVKLGIVSKICFTEVKIHLIYKGICFNLFHLNTFYKFLSNYIQAFNLFQVCFMFVSN